MAGGAATVGSATRGDSNFISLLATEGSGVSKAGSADGAARPGEPNPGEPSPGDGDKLGELRLGNDCVGVVRVGGVASTLLVTAGCVVAGVSSSGRLGFSATSNGAAAVGAGVGAKVGVDVGLIVGTLVGADDSTSDDVGACVRADWVGDEAGNGAGVGARRDDPPTVELVPPSKVGVTRSSCCALVGRSTFGEVVFSSAGSNVGGTAAAE